MDSKTFLFKLQLHLQLGNKRSVVTPLASGQQVFIATTTCNRDHHLQQEEFLSELQPHLQLDNKSPLRPPLAKEKNLEHLSLSCNPTCN
jgi:hypothetical protein